MGWITATAAVLRGVHGEHRPSHSSRAHRYPLSRGTDLIYAGGSASGDGLLTVSSKTGTALIYAGGSANGNGFVFQGFNKTGEGVVQLSVDDYGNGVVGAGLLSGAVCFVAEERPA